MRGIILAAGRGSRMLGLTEHQPKCFARLHGRRLLDWQSSALLAGGIEEIAVVRGYLDEMFTEPVTYFENPRWANSNMVRTLLAADTWLSADDCVVSYSDIVYSPETVRALAGSSHDLAISYDPSWLDLWAARFPRPLDDAESFRRDAEGLLVAIGDQCDSVDEIEGQYMGLLRFTPAGWADVRSYLGSLDADEVDALDMTGLLRRLLERGREIGTVAVRGPWGEVDAPGDLVLYESLIPAPDWL